MHPHIFMQIVKFDVQQVIADLIKQHPDAYLQLAENIGLNELALDKIGKALRSDKLIGAIKELRLATNLGLIDAKNILCMARDDLIAAGKLTKSPGVTATSSVQSLSPEHQSIREAIVRNFR
jgi:hypothetical protein